MATAVSAIAAAVSMLRFSAPLDGFGSFVRGPRGGGFGRGSGPTGGAEAVTCAARGDHGRGLYVSGIRVGSDAVYSVTGNGNDVTGAGAVAAAAAVAAVRVAGCWWNPMLLRVQSIRYHCHFIWRVLRSLFASVRANVSAVLRAAAGSSYI